MTEWQLAEAKNRLSELVNRASSEGPQRIRRRNDRFVLMTEEDYEQLTGQQQSLVEFLLDGPDLSDLDITRDESPMRDVEL